MFNGWDGKQYFDEVNIYDIMTAKWKFCNLKPSPEPRHLASTKVVEDHIIMYGGQGQEYFYDLWLFNTKTPGWQKLYI